MRVSSRPRRVGAQGVRRRKDEGDLFGRVMSVPACLAVPGCEFLIQSPSIWTVKAPSRHYGGRRLRSVSLRPVQMTADAMRHSRLPEGDSSSGKL